MKISLGIKERVVMSAMLPPMGGLIVMRSVKRIQSELEFSPEEIRDFSIKEIGYKTYEWDIRKEAPRDIEILEHEQKYLIDHFNKFIEQMDQDGQVQVTMLDILEKMENLK